MGAKVIAVEAGSKTLRDAVNEALRAWVVELEDTHYILGSAIGPHPFPTMVRDFHRVIGLEARAQVREQTGRLPDAVVACVGGGSNAIGTFYGYKVNGLYQQGDACPLKDATQCAPGEYKVQDTNHDGVISSEDRVILGNAQPKYYGGFNNTFTAGPFSLIAFMNFSVGNKIANVGGAFTELATAFLNESQTVLDRWEPNHTNTMVPRANNQRPRLLYSTLVENGSFLRMQTLTLGYELPRTVIPRVQSARLYLTGQNLFVITGYSGYDPEVNSIGGDTRFAGIDVGAYPRARTYNVGLNLTF